MPKEYILDTHDLTVPPLLEDLEYLPEQNDKDIINAYYNQTLPTVQDE